MVRSFCAVLVLMVGSMAAYGDEFEDKTIEMLKVSNSLQPSIDMMEKMFETMAPVMERNIQASLQVEGKTVSRAAIATFVAEFKVRFIDRVSGELQRSMVDVYRDHFTLAEINALLEVMKTPAFQAYAQKLPKVMAAGMETGQQLGMQVAQQVMAEMQAENDLFK